MSLVNDDGVSGLLLTSLLQTRGLDSEERAKTNKKYSLVSTDTHNKPC